jgi:hypothetical protein
MEKKQTIASKVRIETRVSTLSIQDKSLHQKLLDVINTFGKIVGYKVNIKNPVAFLYTNNEQTGKEIRKKQSPVQ